MTQRPMRQLPLALVAIALAGLAAGILAWATGQAWAPRAWAAGTLPVLAGLLVQIVRSLRRGDVGLDVVAALSMTAALAFGEPLAGNVVALMYAGGQLLESYAEGRARGEMTALLGRVARTAMRAADGRLEEVPIDRLAPGDAILVRQGEVLPVDGTLDDHRALLDQSALTGESLPVEKIQGDELMSGATNSGDAFRLVTLRPAAESTYAHIVRLVEQARDSKAPVVRMADRYAIWFLLLTVALAGTAWWASGDPVRALAVLVASTPCPLILALPVAIISGMSRAARGGVLIKTGGALEALARVRTAILDKTGTLTFGRAAVRSIRTAPGWQADEVLRLAAALDQASNHVIAAALVEEAHRRNLALTPPTDITETAGSGLSGTVEGRRLVVGGPGFVRDTAHVDISALDGPDPEAPVGVAVAVDGELAGLIDLADDPRPDAPDMLASLRAGGIDRVVLASGDRSDVVAAIARRLGIAEAFGDLDPAGKVAVVARETAQAPTLMVGDGVNDAPALAAATVGVAMGARGSAASSESAGVVLLVDRIAPLAAALATAHRTMRIARQSVLVGLGLSLAAMAAAAVGLLPPVAGALTQEVIDVAVILNALRALR